MDRYICPIYGYNGLAESPGADPRHWGSHEICPSCGWQFGYNNPEGLLQYRARWVEAGANWFFREKQPHNWHLASQLANIGLTIQDVLEPAEAAQSGVMNPPDTGCRVSPPHTTRQKRPT